MGSRLSVTHDITADRLARCGNRHLGTSTRQAEPLEARREGDREGPALDEDEMLHFGGILTAGVPRRELRQPARRLAAAVAVESSIPGRSVPASALKFARRHQ